MERSNMKATDLMIGDWIYFCHNDEWDTKIAGKVSLLSYGNSKFNEFPHIEKKAVGRIQVEAKDGFQFWQMDEGRNFEPIPLTPEILEKNGFFLENKNKYPRRFRYNLNNCRGEYIIVDFDCYNKLSKRDWCFPIKMCILVGNDRCSENFVRIYRNDKLYLHELQHAMKLCGIEKEAVL